MSHIVQAVKEHVSVLASPRADAAAAAGAGFSSGVVGRILETVQGLSGWSIALMLLLGAVLYDQCKLFSLKQTCLRQRQNLERILAN
jgi:hypothetical protein